MTAASGGGAITVRAARSPADMDAARALFLAYADSLDFDLCFQGFDAEMARFPGEYTPPDGALLLAVRTADDTALGVVGLRRYDDRTAEMKRLYLDPAARGTGAGRRLATAIVAEARRLGYQRLCLDTVATMTAAIHTYRELGFRQVDGPVDGAAKAGSPDLLYFVLDLT